MKAKEELNARQASVILAKSIGTGIILAAETDWRRE